MELITERGRLDTYDSFTWSLNYRSTEILDLKGRKASYSKTIKIPYNKVNRTVFDGLDEFNVQNVGFNTKSSLRCFISHNGRVLMSGTCQVLELDETKEEKTVELQIIASVKDLITKLKKVKLNEIDFNRWSHEYNAGNIYNNTIWGTCQLDDVQIQPELGRGYVYPLVDFGKDDTLGEASWYVEDLRPSLFLKEYIDTIFRFAGLTYTSNFFDSPYFRSLVILNTQSKLEFSDDQKSEYETELEMNTNFKTALDDRQWIGVVQPGYDSIYIQDEWYYLPFDLEVNDPLDQWTIAPPLPSPATLNGAPSTGNIFVAQKTGTYKFKLTLEYFDEYTIYPGVDFGTAFFFSSIPVGQPQLLGNSTVITERFIEIILNGGIYDNEPLLSQGLPELTYIGDYPAGGPMNWESDGVLKQRFFEYSIDLNIGDYIAFRTLEPQKGTLAPDDPPSVIHRWNFQNIKLGTELIDATVQAGDEISFTNYIPNVKADDFVDAIFNLFNLWVIDDPFNPDNLIIEPRINFFDSGGSIDMSKKLDVSDTINSDFLADKLPRFYKYLFAKADDDANTTWNNLNDIGYADFDSEVDVDFTDKIQKIQTIFGPLIVQRKNGLYYPQEFALDGFLKTPLSASLKIGFVDKQIGDWELRNEFGGADPVTEYWRIAEFDNVTEPNYSLTYGTPSPFISLNQSPYWNLHRLFHELTEWEQTRNGAKMITAKFNLNENDIAELDLRRAWFVNGVYFRLIEISSFNPLSNGTTKVRLLQVENPKFDFTSNEVIYSNAFKNSPISLILGTNDGRAVNTKKGYVLINGNK